MFREPVHSKRSTIPRGKQITASSVAVSALHPGTESTVYPPKQEQNPAVPAEAPPL